MSKRSAALVGLIVASFALLFATAACKEAPKVGAAQAPAVSCACAAKAAAAASDGEAVAAEGAVVVPAQEEQAGEDDELVPVQLVVFGLAASVAILGVLGYLLRRSLGLDRLPPPEDEPSHH